MADGEAKGQPQSATTPGIAQAPRNVVWDSIAAFVDVRAVSAVAFIFFVGWIYLNTYLQRFGLQPSVSGIPLQYHFQYAFRPILGIFADPTVHDWRALAWGGIGCSILAAIGNLIRSARWPCALLILVTIFGVGHSVAAYRGAVDAARLTRGFGPRVQVQFKQSWTDDAGAREDGDPLTVRERVVAQSASGQLILVWRTSEYLTVVIRDKYAFRACADAATDAALRRHIESIQGVVPTLCDRSGEVIAPIAFTIPNSAIAVMQSTDGDIPYALSDFGRRN